MSTPMLPSIPWVPIPITPLPDVFEDNSETTWRLVDAAVRSMVREIA